MLGLVALLLSGRDLRFKVAGLHLSLRHRRLPSRTRHRSFADLPAKKSPKSRRRFWEHACGCPRSNDQEIADKGGRSAGHIWGRNNERRAQGRCQQMTADAEVTKGARGCKRGVVSDLQNSWPPSASTRSATSTRSSASSPQGAKAERKLSRGRKARLTRPTIIRASRRCLRRPAGIPIIARRSSRPRSSMVRAADSVL